jgi:hypothetical protein
MGVNPYGAVGARAPPNNCGRGPSHWLGPPIF